MNRSIRKLVGGGAAALALGGFFALIVSPLVAGAGVSNKVAPGTSISTAALKASVLANVPVAKATAPKASIRLATPSAACTAAKQDLAAARTRDQAEDAAEKTAGTEGTAADTAEDAAERAAIKPLIEAAFRACASPACVTAVSALKAAAEADKAEDVAEKAAGTEGTAADTAEDQAERAKILPLWQAVRADCGFGVRRAIGTHRALGINAFATGTRGTFTWSWRR
jgi:hypothetical protein